MILNKVRNITICIFAFFHIILLASIKFDIFLEYSYENTGRNLLHLISCYCIAGALIGVFLLNMIKCVLEYQPMVYVKNMLCSFICNLVVAFFYNETNLYLERNILDFVSMILLMLSFELIVLFLCVKLLNYKKKNSEIARRQIYRDFNIVALLFFIVIGVAGYVAIHQIGGTIRWTILYVLLLTMPALAVLMVWGGIMYIVSMLKKKY